MSRPTRFRLARFSRNERWSLVVTTIVFGLVLFALDRLGLLTHAHGQMLWQGRVVEKWLFLVVGGVIVFPTLFLAQALMDRVWPEKMTGVHGIPTIDLNDTDWFRNGPPDLSDGSTALDYLEYWISHKPTALQSFAAVGMEATSKYHQALDDQRRKVEDWLCRAPEPLLREILPTLRGSELEKDAHLAFRLCLACQLRGIPSRKELAAYARESRFNELTTMLASEV